MNSLGPPLHLHLHLRDILKTRLSSVSTIVIELWTTLRGHLHSDVANDIALYVFALPVTHPQLDTWIAYIHQVWRHHFRVHECYDGVIFLPQRESLLKRPVMALFQHRHVITNDPRLCGLSIRFYGNARDVERMKQRSWNVLNGATLFNIVHRYGSLLQLSSRLPENSRPSIRPIRADKCLDQQDCGNRWINYPNYDFMYDRHKELCTAIEMNRLRGSIVGLYKVDTTI